jgi:DNA recombination protein RmuC
MDVMHFILLVLVFVVGGVAVWFALRQSRLFAEAGMLSERSARSEELASQTQERFSAAQDQWREHEAKLREAIEAAERAANEQENKSIMLAGELEKQRAMSEQQLAHAKQLAAEQTLAMERAQAMLRDMQASHTKQTEDAIKRLASEALQQNNKSLIETAQQVLAVDREKSKLELAQRTTAVEQLVQPIRDVLTRTDAKLGQLEQGLTQSSATLAEQVRALSNAGEQLRSETSKLVKALREPHVRGRYGELQLKRVAELAGMAAYCDFDLQVSERDSEGDIARPDMVVRMPTGRSIVVDAKTNIQAYLDAHQSDTTDEATQQLDRFARHIAEQAGALAKKKYWAKVDGSPEFVVMFLPNDAFLDAALQRRPDLMDQAHNLGVVLATPSSLIALLRVVAMGFREQRLAEEAAELRKLGAELHDKAAVAMEYVARLGNSLNESVNRYNDFVGSYQHRLEPSLRKFAEAGLRGAKELPRVVTVDAVSRAPSPALLAGSGSDPITVVALPSRALPNLHNTGDARTDLAPEPSPETTTPVEGKPSALQEQTKPKSPQKPAKNGSSSSAQVFGNALFGASARDPNTPQEG